MKISGLRKEVLGEEVALVANVESVRWGNDTIWVSVPSEYESWLCTEQYDGFLVSLLYPAMAYGEDIWIQGTVSKRLLRNINKFIQEILLGYNPELHRINISATEVSSDILNTTTQHIATGFSGGIDSFSTIYDNLVNEIDSKYKIDTFVCLNVGSHGEYNGRNGCVDTEAMFRSRYEFLKQYPDSIDIPFIPVNSNIHYYHEWGHQLTHTLTLVSGILAMQRMFSKYYIASAGINYDQWIDSASKYRKLDIAEFAEPHLTPLLSTETTEFILDGMQHTRVQKTINITNYSLTKQYLNVCLVNEPQKKNCGICPKCVRVGLTLSDVGKLDGYKDVFDIENFRKHEWRFRCEAVLNYKFDTFSRDIVDFAKKSGGKYPSYFMALTHTLISPSRKAIAAISYRFLGREISSKLISICKKRKENG